MDTLRRRYHAIGNKINTVMAYLSDVKDVLAQPAPQKPGCHEDVVKKFDVMERNLLELNEMISRIKGINYRFMDPNQDIGELVDKIVLENKDIKLLVVDDEEDLCKLLKENVGRLGVQVETVSDAAGARKAIIENTPHIVLLDLYMQEGMEGLELLRFLRKERPQVKCLVVTWEYNEDVLKMVRELKPEEIMVKPVMPSQLKAKINGLIVTMAAR